MKLKQFLPGKYFTVYSFLLAFALLVGYFIFLPARQEEKMLTNIKEGRLNFYPELGWVDMGHANPDGPSEQLVQAIDKHKGGTLTYSQDMKKNIFGFTVVVRITNSYSIPEKLGKQRNGIIRFVFDDVSKDFEALQARHPFRNFCGYALGDINGDRIALLRALKLPRPKRFMDPVSHERALEVYYEQRRNPIRISTTVEEMLPTPIWVYKYNSTIEYFIE